MDLYFASNKYTKLCVILQIYTNQTQRLSRLLLTIASKRKLSLYVLTTFYLHFVIIQNKTKQRNGLRNEWASCGVTDCQGPTTFPCHLTRNNGQWTVLFLWDASLRTSELLLALVQQTEDRTAKELLGWQTWQDQQYFRPQSFQHLPELHKGQF